MEKDLKISLIEYQNSRKKFQIENMLAPQQPLELNLENPRRIECPRGINAYSRSLERSQKRADTTVREGGSPDGEEINNRSMNYSPTRDQSASKGKKGKNKERHPIFIRGEKISHRDERLAMKIKEIEKKHLQLNNNIQSPNAKAGIVLPKMVEREINSPKVTKNIILEPIRTFQIVQSPLDG